MKLQFITAVFLICAIYSFGQSNERSILANSRYIDVTGSAEREIDPNQITVSIALKEYEENKSKVSIEALDKDFQSAVSKSRIQKDRISIAKLSINAITQKKRDREAFAEKVYLIRFSDSEDLMAFMKNLSGITIERFYIVELTHTDIVKYRLELKIQALKAAEYKAEQLLSAVGAKKGKPLIISELDPIQNPWMPQDIYSNTMMSREMPVEEEGGFSIKKISLRYEIKALFEIE
ncbi:MAG: SIMPL domain-containing protein [Cyclobacteriaceae bacterium]|nr:SIMPL domain-containing protein [Cyclobacteriaceae bacterium]